MANEPRPLGPTDIGVRPARAEDRAALRGLILELQAHERALRPSRRPGETMVDAYLEALESELAETAAEGDAALVLVATRCEAVIGMASLFFDDDPLDAPSRMATIEDLVVTRAERRHGVGRALVAAARAIAFERGAARLSIETLIANRDAEAAYRALGFRPAYLTLELDLASEVDPVPAAP